jgi:hypothetical protein
MQSTDFTTQTSENGFIGIGPTARATIGAFRVSNATTALAARNAAGGADIALVATTAADKVVIGDGVTAATLDIKAAGDTAVLRGAATKATIGAAKVTLTDGALELGLSAVVSTVGNVRVPNATTAVAARNAGGGADIALIATTGADQVAIGDAVNAEMTGGPWPMPAPPPHPASANVSVATNHARAVVPAIRLPGPARALKDITAPLPIQHRIFGAQPGPPRQGCLVRGETLAHRREGPCWLVPQSRRNCDSNCEQQRPETSTLHTPTLASKGAHVPSAAQLPRSMHGDRDGTRVLQRSRGCRNRNREILRGWGIATATTSRGQTQSQ